MGIESNEYMALNAYLLHPGFYEGKFYFDEISSIIGISVADMEEIVRDLLLKEIIVVENNRIDNMHLYRTLQKIEHDMKTIKEKLIDSYEDYRQMGGYREFG
jgi:hypothetical protein